MCLHSLHDITVLSRPVPENHRQQNPHPDHPPPLAFLYSKVLVQLEQCEMILIWTPTPTPHPLTPERERERWHAQRLHKFTMKHEHTAFQNPGLFAVEQK